ncbi:MAG: aminotransferase class V-fold PLP-dependent enzyme, partial [Treponema sp.]|nr:aminotransferase class V-fold PLP-dependent enzyme [Treponema sp.]
MIKQIDEKRHYFDWAASSPYFPNHTDSRCETDNLYGNPSSLHSEGRAAKTALEDARARCADVLKVPPETLFFTSGGTESNGIALLSTLGRIGKGRVISSLGEHPSIREGMETLEKMGKLTGSITIDASGRVTPVLMEKAIVKYGDVRFVSIMSVNNETGSITDIDSLKKKNSELLPPAHFHCDIVQSVGKIPVDITGWEIDSASISAHKIGGPRGIGLLYFRKSTAQSKP